MTLRDPEGWPSSRGWQHASHQAIPQTHLLYGDLEEGDLTKTTPNHHYQDVDLAEKSQNQGNG